MQTQAVIQRRGFIIYEFQALSDNPISYQFLVNNCIRNTCPAGRPEYMLKFYFIHYIRFVSNRYHYTSRASTNTDLTTPFLTQRRESNHSLKVALDYGTIKTVLPFEKSEI